MFKILKNEIEYLQRESSLEPFKDINKINIDEFGDLSVNDLSGYLTDLRMYFSQIAREATLLRDNVYRELEIKMGKENLHKLREDNYNKAIADIVLNRHEINGIFKTEDRLIQKKDPIYMIPESNIGRAHFYAPFKKLNNIYFDTLWFNISAIWFMSIILYIVILYNLPRMVVTFFESFTFLRG